MEYNQYQNSTTLTLRSLPYINSFPLGDLEFGTKLSNLVAELILALKKGFSLGDADEY